MRNFPHPLAFVGIVLWLGLILAIGNVIRHGVHRKERAFGLAGLTLVAWLDLLSFLAGFSIGWILSIISIALGLFLAAVAAHYRRQILFAAFVGLLLGLFMRGHYLPAREILEFLLAGATLRGLVLVLRNWNSRDDETFGAASLGALACSGGLALLVPPSAGAYIAIATTGMGLILGMLSKYFRWQLFLLAGGTVLWALNLLFWASS